MPSERPVTLPKRKHYVLSNATVPVGCLKGVDIDKLDICVDRLSQVDIEVLDGKIVAASSQSRIFMCLLVARWMQTTAG